MWTKVYLNSNIMSRDCFAICVCRLLPGLVLLSAISVLQCNAYYLMAVTTGGDVFVWLVIGWFV
jgi:hypothetical protein